MSDAANRPPLDPNQKPNFDDLHSSSERRAAFAFLCFAAVFDVLHRTKDIPGALELRDTFLAAATANGLSGIARGQASNAMHRQADEKAANAEGEYSAAIKAAIKHQKFGRNAGIYGVAACVLAVGGVLGSTVSTLKNASFQIERYVAGWATESQLKGKFFGSLFADCIHYSTTSKKVWNKSIQAFPLLEKCGFKPIRFYKPEERIDLFQFHFAALEKRAREITLIASAAALASGQPELAAILATFSFGKLVRGGARAAGVKRTQDAYDAMTEEQRTKVDKRSLFNENYVAAQIQYFGQSALVGMGIVAASLTQCVALKSLSFAGQAIKSSYKFVETPFMQIGFAVLRDYSTYRLYKHRKETGKIDGTENRHITYTEKSINWVQSQFSFAR